MTEMYEKITSNGKSTLFVNTISNKTIIQISKTDKEGKVTNLSVQGDINMLMWLYDMTQKGFASYVSKLELPLPLIGGIGRRYNWL